MHCRYVGLLIPQHVIKHEIHDYNLDILQKSYIMQ